MLILPVVSKNKSQDLHLAVVGLKYWVEIRRRAQNSIGMEPGWSWDGNNVRTPQPLATSSEAPVVTIVSTLAG